MDPRQQYPMNGSIAVVPIEWLPFFIEDPANAAMEYLCHPTGATNPFFRDSSKVSEAIHPEMSNPLDWETYNLHSSFQAGPDRRPRYMHIDLAINNDGAGISMAHCNGFKGVHARSEDGKFGEVMLPIVQWDFAGILRPRKDRGEKEMNYDAIMALLFEVLERGFNLMNGLLTFDRFQSHHMKNTLHTFGFNVAALSIDHTTSKLVVDYEREDRVRKDSLPRQPAAAMMSLREVLYQGRGVIPAIPMHKERNVTWLEKEAAESQTSCANAQRLLKVEKAHGGSDDLIQSMAGACFNVVNNSVFGMEVEQPVNRAALQRENDFYDQFDRSTEGHIPRHWIEESDFENPRLQGQGGDQFYIAMQRDELGL